MRITSQCDSKGEYMNMLFILFYVSNGIQFRFLSPNTSQQIGKSKCMIWFINNIVPTLLFHAHMPPRYLVEALLFHAHITHSSSIQSVISQSLAPTNHNRPLRMLMLYYPYFTTSSKYDPRSTHCVFLEYPSQRKGFH